MAGRSMTKTTEDLQRLNLLDDHPMRNGRLEGEENEGFTHKRKGSHYSSAILNHTELDGMHRRKTVGFRDNSQQKRLTIS